MEPKDEIKQRLDVVEIVGEYLTLATAGGGSFKSVCPFHSEKTPSFYVSKDKQIWHCFGCDKGGDLISFVMEIEGMSFPEALRHLGKKAGVEIPEYRPSPNAHEHEFLIALQDLAAKFYETLLWQHDEGAVARAYLQKRGISEELAKKFRLGYAPERWDALKNVLLKRGFDEKRLLKAGLVKEKREGSGVIDRFRNRLMIPLCDARGQVLGFTGRLLGEQTEKTGPKYLNSPETPIYHKSDVLFGLDLARNMMRQSGFIIVVEGNLDVVASHKAGIENVVASSGTALTESQLRQLKKMTDHLIFSFDADNAGYNAARRGIKLATELGFKIHVISIPQAIGKDPDDIVQRDPEAWQRLVKSPIHIMEYYFQKALTMYNDTNVDSKRELANFIVQEIARFTDVIEQEHWLQKLSDVIHVDMSVLKSLLAKQTTPAPKTTPEKTTALPQLKKPKITSRVDQAASFLIGAAVYDAEAANEIFGRLSDADLLEEPWGRIYKKMVLTYTQHRSHDSTQKQLFSELRQSLQQDGAEADLNLLDAAVLRVESLLAGLSRNDVREELNRHLTILRDASSDAHRKQLEAAIRQAERSGDSDRVKALMQEYSKLL